MARGLEGRPPFYSVWRGRGIAVMMPERSSGPAYLRRRRSLRSANPGSHLSLRRWRCWAGLATVKRASCRACIVRCRSISIWEGSGNIMPGRDASTVNIRRRWSCWPRSAQRCKGQNRHFDRTCAEASCNSCYGGLRKSRAEILPSLYARRRCADATLRPRRRLAEAWCRMMLDTRGGMRLMS